MERADRAGAIADAEAAPVRWDVFLSYHSVDAASAAELCARLTAHGITAFIDQTRLPAGLPWAEALEDALRSSRAVVVLLGGSGLGRWQRREVWFALDLQATLERAGRRYPVIPVLLPGAQLTASFLALNTGVDLREAAARDAQLQRLIAAVRLDPGAAAGAVAVAACPYRGLQAFDETDAGLYFGREHYRDALLALIQQPGRDVVVVTGASGSGKSSLVAAGLVPLLRRERPPQRTWDVAWFTPGDAPWRRLADALVGLLAPDASAVAQLHDAAVLAADLEADRGMLRAAIRRVLEQSRGAQRLLLVVDQFEELFTLTAEPARAAFVDCLLDAAGATGAAMTLIVTLRSDFFGAAASLSRALADRINAGQLVIGPMRDAELAAAIEQPALRVGLVFDPGLVDRIVGDVRAQPGGLPLLEYALTELWKARSGNRLTHEAYRDTGGVAGAIATRAEAVFAALGPEQQVVAERLFSRLVRVAAADEEGADTRRRVIRAEIGEPGWAIAQRFAGPEVRLLVIASDPAIGADTVEVAHEALLRCWSRLGGWIRDNRAFLRWRLELGRELARWEAAGRSEGLLLRGEVLATALDWCARRGADLNDHEAGFIRWTVRDEFHIEKIRADAARLLRFAEGDAERSASAAVDWRVVAHLLDDAPEDDSIAGDALLGALAEIRARLGELDRASALVARIADSARCATGWLDVLRAALAAGDLARVEAAARAAIELAPTEWARRGTTERVCIALVGTSLEPLAHALIAGLDRWVRRQVQVAVVAATLADGRAASARSFAEAIADADDRAHALLEIAARTGDAALARALIAARVPDGHDGEAAAGRALLVVARVHDVDDAVTAAESVAAPERRVAVVRELIRLAPGDAAVPQALCAVAEIAARSIAEPHARNAALEALIGAVAAAGMTEPIEPLARAAAPPGAEVLLLASRLLSGSATRARAVDLARAAFDAAQAAYRRSMPADEALTQIVYAGGIEPALASARAIAERGDRQACFVHVVRTLVRLGDAAAIEVAREAIAGAAPGDPVWRQVAEALCDAGDAEPAVMLGREIWLLDGRIDVHVAVVRALTARQRAEVRHDLLVDLVAVARGHADDGAAARKVALAVATLEPLDEYLLAHLPLAELLREVPDVVAVLARDERFEDAIRIASSLAPPRTAPAAGMYRKVWAEIIGALDRAGQDARAVEYARRTVRGLHATRLPEAISAVLFRASELSLLAEVADAIESSGEQALALCELSRHPAVRGTARATSLLDRASAIAAAQPGDLRRHVAGALVEAGEPRAALRLLAEIGRAPPRPGFWARLRRKPPAPAAALETVPELVDQIAPRTRDRARDVVVAALAAAGEQERALAIAGEEADPPRRTRLLAAAAQRAASEIRGGVIGAARAAARMAASAELRFDALLAVLEVAAAIADDPVRRGALDDVIATTEVIDPAQREHARRRAISRLARAGWIAAVQELAGAAATPAARADGYAEVLGAQAALSASDLVAIARAALPLVAAIEPYAGRRLARTVLAAVAPAAGESLDALAALIEPAPARAEGLTAAILPLTRAGHRDRAVRTTAAVIALAEAMPERWQRDALITGAVVALGEGLLDDALALVRGLDADRGAELLVDMLERLPRHARMANLVAAALVAGPSITGPARSVRLRRIVASLAKHGASALAISVAEDPAHRGEPGVLAALVEAGQLAAARRIASAMIEDAHRPSSPAHGALLSQILGAFVPREVAAALELAERIPPPERDPALASQVGPLIASGHTAAAWTVLRAVRSEREQVRARCDAIKAFAKSGQRWQAEQLAGEVLRVVVEREHAARVAEALIAAGMAPRVAELADAEQLGTAVRQALVVALCNDHLEHGRSDRALALLPRLAGDEVSGSLIDLCDALVQRDRLDDAAELIRRCAVADPGVRADGAVAGVVAAAVACGRTDLAIELAHRHHSAIELLLSLAAAVLARGAADDAAAVVRSIASPAGRVRGLAVLAIRIQDRDRPRAETWLAEAGQTIEAIADYNELSQAWGWLAIARAVVGQLGAARDAADRCHVPEQRLRAYTAIVHRYLVGRRPALRAPLAAVLGPPIPLTLALDTRPRR